MSSRPPPTTNLVEPEDRSDTWATLLRIGRALRKNWITVFAVAATTLLGATFFTLGQKKIYRASGSVQIDPNPPRPLGNEVQGVVEMGTGTYLNNREYYETQYRIIKSHRVAKAVVQQLALHRDGAFLANAPPGQAVAPVEIPVETAAEILKSRIDVEPDKQSRLVTISFEDADPERAHRIVNAVIENYREQNLDNVLASTTSAVDWLKGQLGNLRGELEKAEISLHDFKKQKNVLSVSFEDQSNMLRGEMTKLNDLLTEVRANREELDARRKELGKVDPKDPANLPASELINNGLLQRLREGYIDAVRDRASLAATGKGAAHPTVAAADSRVETTRKALLAEVKNIQGAVERDYRTVSRHASGLERLYNAANTRALELNLMEIEYNRLRRSKENTERLYSLVLDRTKESDLTRMMRVNNIHVVDEPLLPKAPVKPSVPTNLAIGLLAGLALGFATALGREMLDRSIKTPDDLEREIGLTFLGMLPQVGDAARAPSYGRRSRRKSAKSEDLPPELLVYREPTSAMAEAARAIRTNILFMSPDNPHRTVLVTSATPAEGKTTVACCLAVAMAQAGQRVVLVDCDMRRPRIHKVFGASNHVGITTAMLDPDSLDEAFLDSPVPNLTVVPCGPIPPNPAELLHSESFGRVLQLLQKRFDRIVIDSPPLLPVTDSAVLSTRVDGTVVVVRALKTAKDAARQAVRSIRDVGGNLAGAVLNAVDTTRRGYSYYYHNYHYYRSDYRQIETESDDDDSSQDAPSPPPN